MIKETFDVDNLKEVFRVLWLKIERMNDFEMKFVEAAYARWLQGQTMKKSHLETLEKIWDAHIGG